jgi:hypothetical protein
MMVWVDSVQSRFCSPLFSYLSFVSGYLGVLSYLWFFGLGGLLQTVIVSCAVLPFGLSLGGLVSPFALRGLVCSGEGRDCVLSATPLPGFALYCLSSCVRRQGLATYATHTPGAPFLDPFLLSFFLSFFWRHFSCQPESCGPILICSVTALFFEFGLEWVVGSPPRDCC